MDSKRKNPHVAMEDSALPATPTKKVKLEQPSSTFDVTMEEKRAESPSMVISVTATAAKGSADANRTLSEAFNAVQSSDTLDKEAVCGITEFVSPDLPGFTGVLKKRYTDFLVNEILPSGLVIHLDNLKAPKQPEKQELPFNGVASHPRDHKQDVVQNPLYEELLLAQRKQDPGVPPTEVNGDIKAEPQSFVQGKLGAETTTITAAMDSSSIQQMTVIPSGIVKEDSPTSKPSTPSPAKNEPGYIAPHLRIPPTSPYVPLSMRDLNGNESPTKPEQKRRKKETVLIRQTAEGWVEVDEAKEKEMKERKVLEDAIGETPPSPNDTEHSAKQEMKTEDKETMAPPPAPSTQAQWQAFGPPTPAFRLNEGDRTILVNYFGTETVDAILALYNRIVDSPNRRSKEYGMVRSDKISRETRSKLHQDIRRIFSSRLETVTDNDGAMIITAMVEKPIFHARTTMNNDRGNGRGGGRGSGRGHDRGNRSSQWSKPSWKDLGGDHLHFSLYKENKDTMEAISWLSKELKVRPGAFQFAGTKDRRGVTVQRVSIYRILVDRLIAAGRTMRQARIGNFEYQPHQLQLGELSGNEFLITLRDCDFAFPMPVDSKAMIDEVQSIVGTAIDNLVNKGFLNYFGLQRFGSFSTGTDDVGVKMLQGDFQGAVDAILHFTPAALAAAQDPSNDNDMISNDDKARAYGIHEFRSTGRSQPALNDIPRKFSAEASIIRHLSGNNRGNDNQGAMQTIQRNLCLMYVHAYQSLVWNTAASERWKRFSRKVIEGDLVLVDEHAAKEETNIKSEDVDIDGEAVVHPAEDDRAADPEDKFTRARALTKEEAESGEYTIFDIVLPTPGYDILYPANEMLQFYEEFMASERGGGLNPHDMRRSWKAISLSGSYRKVVAKPLNDVTFEVKVYRDENEQFVKTDLDRINEAKPQQRNAQHSRSTPLLPAKDEVNGTKDKAGESIGGLEPPRPNIETKSEGSDNEPGGVSLDGGLYKDYKIAVILKMQLGTSQYATMALRELMKQGGVKTYKPDFGGGR